MNRWMDGQRVQPSLMGMSGTKYYMNQLESPWRENLGTAWLSDGTKKANVQIPFKLVSFDIDWTMEKETRSSSHTYDRPSMQENPKLLQQGKSHSSYKPTHMAVYQQVLLPAWKYWHMHLKDTPAGQVTYDFITPFGPVDIWYVSVQVMQLCKRRTVFIPLRLLSYKQTLSPNTQSSTLSFPYLIKYNNFFS